MIGNTEDCNYSLLNIEIAGTMSLIGNTMPSLCLSLIESQLLLVCMVLELT